jgi:fumarylacetoacetate (FAA) hydrolase
MKSSEVPSGSKATWSLSIPQFCDGSAYLNHAKRIRAARGDTLPDSAYDIPLMYQAVSDRFLMWCGNIPPFPYEYKLDFEAEIGVIIDKVLMGSNIDEAAEKIKYVTIINDISLRQLCAIEIKTGFGFLQGKPHSSLGKRSIPITSLSEEQWHDSKLHATMVVEFNDKQIGKFNTSLGMHFNFAELIVHAAKTRDLSKGTLIGSGTLSSENINDGFGCLLEQNVVSSNNTYMKSGDRIKMYIEEFSNMLVIDQKVL